jgi:uncharacterized protein
MTETAFPTPSGDPIAEPFWAALDEGLLKFQRCSDCGHRWLPPRSECQNCLSPRTSWERASGDATLISWVVYHHAYHPAFAARLPYTVAIVQLAEGPRMVTNIVGSDDPESLRIDQALRLRIEREEGVSVPRFVPISEREGGTSS